MSDPTPHPPVVDRDDLRDLAHGTPPFVSIYLDLSPTNRDTLVARIAAVADGLRDLGAPADLVERTTTPFLAPPRDRSAMGIVSSSDGRVVIASSPEPINRDLGEFGLVPHLAPVIEWSQQMITHAIVRSTGPERTDVVIFGADGTTHSTPAVDISRDLDELTQLLVSHSPSAVFLFGANLTAVHDALTELVLAQRLPSSCRLEMFDDGDDDQVADAVVRHAASVVASRKVELLSEFRFELSHGRAVEGVDAVVHAANEGLIATLIANADPNDHRRAEILGDGTIRHHVGTESTAPVAARGERLVDAIVLRVLRKSGAPVIIPRTGDRGPADDLGALLRPRDAADLMDLQARA